MRTDISIQATLGQSFKALINAELDDSYVEEIQVFSVETGQDLTDLLEGSPAWDQAWNIAERHAISLPTVQRSIAKTFRELTHDTPFRG